MKLFIQKIPAVFLLLSIFGCATQPVHECKQTDEVLYQVSTIQALLDGDYNATISFGELKKHGDFGIGTFENIDGEMVGIDGDFYRVKANGEAFQVVDTIMTSYSAVTFFEADEAFEMDTASNYKSLQSQIDNMLTNKNVFYAIKIEGTFDYIKTRSIPGQTKPYPPLLDVIAKQTIRESENIKGTMIGFWCPAFLGKVNVPGFHFHFLSADKSFGGHVLDIRSKNLRVAYDVTADLYVDNVMK